MFNCKIFEKTPLQAYNEKLDIFQIKFDIFSELQEFQKIGRMTVSKNEFFVSNKEIKEMKEDVEDEKEDDEVRRKINRLKIISKIKEKKLIRDITNIKLYVQEVKENDDKKEKTEESVLNSEEEKEDTEKEDTEKEDTEKEDTEKEDTEKEDTEKEDTEKEDTEKEDKKEIGEDEKDKKKYDIYYIFDTGYFQKLSRWWYSENREKTKKYITEDFSEFVKYLNEIKNMYSYYSVNIYYKNLLKKIHKFINKITPGLYNLKKTYKDNKEIKAQVDSIILTMLDFKNETEIKKVNSSNSILSLLHQHNKTHILI